VNAVRVIAAFRIILSLLCEEQEGQNPARVKYWKITADLSVILMTAALAITSAQAEPPPAAIDCTFYPVKFPKRGDFSKTTVAPKDIAWIASDHPYPRPDEITTGLVVWDKNYRQWGFVVLGSGTGRLTPSTDLPKLCIQLAAVASEHGANAISYQIFNHGTQIRVQFLRIEDGYFRTARRGQNLPREVRGN
jgi:hypothetical protein